MTATNVRLMAANASTQLYTVQPSRFHRTLETTGVVDFDNDQATSVLAPFSGPVSRLLVSLGAQVKAGSPLAVVDSPDFATAISAYRKALTTAQTSRRLADLDKDLLEHNGVSQREQAQAETDAVSAEADRDAALQELISLKVAPQTIGDIRDGRQVAHTEATIRSPIAGQWSRDSSPRTTRGGQHALLHGCRPPRVWVLAQLVRTLPTSASATQPRLRRNRLAQRSGKSTTSCAGRPQHQRRGRCG